MKKLIVGLLAILVLTACANGSSASIQGQWKLVSYGSTSSQKLAVPNVDTSVEFGSDGTVKGSVGCNSFGGDFTVNSNTIIFGAIAATEMFCEAIADQEAGTFAVLQDKTTFVLDGDTLTITSANGNSIVLKHK